MENRIKDLGIETNSGASVKLWKAPGGEPVSLLIDLGIMDAEDDDVQDELIDEDILALVRAAVAEGLISPTQLGVALAEGMIECDRMRCGDLLIDMRSRRIDIAVSGHRIAVDGVKPIPFSPERAHEIVTKARGGSRGSIPWYQCVASYMSDAEIAYLFAVKEASGKELTTRQVFELIIRDGKKGGEK